MPTNITRGNSAEFTVRFTDTSGNPVAASSASVTLNYFIGGALNSSSIDLVLTPEGFWSATWSSAGVDLGSVPWVVASSATLNPAKIGELRVIDP